AYEVARQFLFEEAGEGTSDRTLSYGVSTQAWSRLWQICVPPKVKVLIWRVLLNILPTRERLRSKGIQGDVGVCGLCGAREETLHHVLLDCSFTALIWQNSPLQTEWRDHDTRDLNGWLEHILMGGDRHKTELLFMLIWNLWNERNTVVWTAKRRSPCEVVDGAVRLLQEFKEHQPTMLQPLSRAQAKWQKPPLGAIKINVDGALHVQTGSGGGGIMARDSAGCFVAARACRFSHVSSLEHAEILALRAAILFSHDLGPGPKIIEGDAQGVIQTVQTAHEDRSILSFLFSDCKFLLSQLENTSIQFAFREANRVAHRLARLAITLPGTLTWLQDPPDAVCDVLVEDIL
ncbi:uncharacterized protein LOC110747027, partial [Prunus avium]|uniref:Uncharacterized protein LOC110747027 n=1 Tax=Prunus avium TaxID=42229 RepID=A0A6P5RLZ5_PRUAV